MSEHPRREIRSFVKREGRLTPGQQRALDELFPRFGITIDADTPRPLDLPALFGRDAPVTLEIGFGNGEAMTSMATAAPEQDFLGIEVHRPGVGHLLLKVEEAGLGNVRALNHDAVEVVRDYLPEGALSRVLIWFADPWPKKKHHKRRIVQPGFVELLRTLLRPGGILHLATDWQDYAEHQREVMEAAPGWENLAGPGNFSPKPDYRPETKFERRGLKLGHGVWDLLYRRVD